MSRIGKHPVELASGVSATIADGFITVKGPKGEVKMHILPRIRIDQEGNVLKFVQTEETRESNANVGTMRALVADMNKGVSQGFEKKLEINGVGYRASKEGKNLVMNLGYSHQVIMSENEDIQIDVPDANHVTVKGIDKQKVGQFAAELRGKRPPEPYKGKGIKYDYEVIRRKEGKTGAK